MKKKISENEKPEIYAVNRGKRGWKLNRRNFLAGAATMGAALAGKELVPKAAAQESISSPETAPSAACSKIWAHTSEISSLVFSSDGKFLASSSFDNKVKLWDAAKQGHLHTYDAHKGDVRALAFSKDGKWLLSGSDDKTVKVWNLKNNKLRKNFTKHDDEIYGVCVLPSSKQAVSVTQDGNYMLWNVPSGELISSWRSTFTVPYIWSLAVSPNGNLLASGHYNKISLVY